MDVARFGGPGVGVKVWSGVSWTPTANGNQSKLLSLLRHPAGPAAGQPSSMAGWKLQSATLRGSGTVHAWVDSIPPYGGMVDTVYEGIANNLLKLRRAHPRVLLKTSSMPT